MKEAQVLTHLHLSSYQFAPKGVLLFSGPTTPRTAKCPKPLRTQKGVTSCASDAMHHVGRHSPIFLATPGSYASPIPSYRLGFTFGQPVQNLPLSAPAGSRTFATLSPDRSPPGVAACHIEPPKCVR